MVSENTSGIVLAGGFGTRIAALAGGLPKPMLPVAGRPFLEYLVAQLRATGVTRIVMATGYRSDAVEDHFGDGSAWGVSIAYSRETQPMGTGGAVRMAAELVEAERFLVLNGDSFFAIDPAALLAGVVPAGGAVVGLAAVRDTSRYGSVELDATGHVTRFVEKATTGGPGTINAGVYAFTKEALSGLPLGRASSLENDLLPALARSKLLIGVRFDAYFMDIGLPETYLALEADPSHFVRAVGSPETGPR